jgi:hypothetical protein
VVRFPAEARDLSRLQSLETSSEAHLSSCSVDTGGFSPGVKWWLREIDQSPPSSTEVKNEHIYTPLPAMPSWHAQGKLYLLYITDIILY